MRFDLRSSQIWTKTLVVLTVVLIAGSAVAQRTTGTLRGQVLDPQDAVVVDAQVTVTNDATGISQVVTTTSAGTYNLPSVLPGNRV